jgi:hypothetical protein
MDNTWSIIQEVCISHVVQQGQEHPQKFYDIIPKGFIIEVTINGAPRQDAR